MPIRQVLIVVSLGALTGLSSCGGGGGGSVGPTFPITPANLTSANAPSFARFAELAARAGATARLGEFLNSTASPTTFTDTGCVGAPPTGIATVTLTAPSGPVSGSAAYTNFDRCYGMRVNGTANIANTSQMIAGGRVDLMNLTFSGLTFTAGNETFQASGSASVDWTSVAPASTYLMTVNATVSGSASFRLENFQINSQIVPGREELFISGRLTTGDGFVDIGIGPTRLELPIPSNGLQNGQITMTGATTIATVIYSAGTTTITIVPR